MRKWGKCPFQTSVCHRWPLDSFVSKFLSVLAVWVSSKRKIDPSVRGVGCTWVTHMLSFTRYSLKVSSISTDSLNFSHDRLLLRRQTVTPDSTRTKNTTPISRSRSQCLPRVTERVWWLFRMLHGIFLHTGIVNHKIDRVLTPESLSWIYTELQWRFVLQRDPLRGISIEPQET